MSSVLPMRCADCRLEFLPHEGGRCLQCGRLCCLLHLRRDRTSGDLYCAACAEAAAGRDLVDAGSLTRKAQLRARWAVGKPAGR